MELKVLTCPACLAGQVGDPIPVRYQPLVTMYVCDEAGGRCYSKSRIIEVAGVYAGPLYAECWYCGERWHIWPKDSDEWIKAVAYVTGKRSRKYAIRKRSTNRRIGSRSRGTSAASSHAPNRKEPVGEVQPRRDAAADAGPAG